MNAKAQKKTFASYEQFIAHYSNPKIESKDNKRKYYQIGVELARVASAKAVADMDVENSKV